MLVPITEQVFVPLHRIERISFFSDHAIIKIVDDREVHKIFDQDAKNLMAFINQSVFPKQPVVTVIDTAKKGKQ